MPSRLHSRLGAFNLNHLVVKYCMWSTHTSDCYNFVQIFLFSRTFFFFLTKRKIDLMRCRFDSSVVIRLRNDREIYELNKKKASVRQSSRYNKIKIGVIQNKKAKTEIGDKVVILDLVTHKKHIFGEFSHTFDVCVWNQSCDHTSIYVPPAYSEHNVHQIVKEKKATQTEEKKNELRRSLTPTLQRIKDNAKTCLCDFQLRFFIPNHRCGWCCYCNLWVFSFRRFHLYV